MGKYKYMHAYIMHILNMLCRCHVFLSPPCLKQSTEPPLFVTVFLGANDAVLPGRSSEKQYVPLDRYRDNLRSIVSHIRSTSKTPPPVACPRPCPPEETVTPPDLFLPSQWRLHNPACRGGR